jgi:small subunit ribosomal protein S16
MVKIRLARHGAKKRPYYHIVVSDSEKPRDGRFLEQIGTYDPSRPDEEMRLDLDRVDYWVGVGAQPTGRVKKLVNVYRRMAAAAPAEAPKAEAKPAEEKPAEAKAEEAPKAEGESTESEPAEA